MYIKEYNCTVKDIINRLNNKEIVKLLSYDIDNNDSFEDVCINYHDSGIQDVYKYTLSNGQILECTENHKFLCTDNKYYTIKDIEQNCLQIKDVML